MKNKHLNLFMIVAILSFAPVSCVREEMDNSSSVKTIDHITASKEEFPKTKTHIENGTSLVWDDGDQVGVYSDMMDTPVSYLRHPDYNGRFFGDPVTGSEFYAFFPFDSFTRDEDSKNILHHSNWIANYYKAGDSRTGLYPPMVAKGNGEDLTFLQTCGILHFKMRGSLKIEQFILLGNDGETIWCEGDIDMSMDKPVLVPKENPGDENATSIRFHQGDIQLSPDSDYDLYFVVPPMTFEHGFTLRVIYYGESEDKMEVFDKVSYKPLTIKRAVMSTYTLPDIEGSFQEQEDAIKDILLQIYNNHNGVNWKDQDGWFTDRDISEWSGVTIRNGKLVELSFLNKFMGTTFPEEVFSFPDLEYLLLSGSGITGTIPEEISSLRKLRVLFLGNNNLEGTIPESLFSMEELRQLQLNGNNLSGGLSDKISLLENLGELNLSDNNFEGELPEELFNCTSLYTINLAGNNFSGTLSPSVGKLSNLQSLNLSNNAFSGPLPSELTLLPEDVGLNFTYNSFSGKIPSEFDGWEPWNRNWYYIAGFNEGLDYTDVRPHCPKFSVTLLDGSTFTEADLSRNDLTIIASDGTWCPGTIHFHPTLDKAWRSFKDEGLDILEGFGNEPDGTPEQNVRNYVSKHGIEWKTFYSHFGNSIPLNPDSYPLFFAYDSQGVLVWASRPGRVSSDGTEEDLRSTLIPFLEERYGKSASEYSSTDFSRDGTVINVQKAEEGEGINVVFMGDAFSDRQVQNGTYRQAMDRAIEAFFCIEPIKSYRKLFNVDIVETVSVNESYFEGRSTALDTYYQGRETLGNDDKVFGYASKAVGADALDECLVVVVLNELAVGSGTCSIHTAEQGIWGSGPAVAYTTNFTEDDYFIQTLVHEAAGHGFGKLADEYYSNGSGTIPSSKVGTLSEQQQYGHWKNITFSGDPSSAPWASFINDPLYANEKIGLYEGGDEYNYGVWRPSQHSIMRCDEMYFNAPSREAIWCRMHALAYGSSWTYNRQEFIEYDAVNRQMFSAAAQAPMVLAPKNASENAGQRTITHSAPVIHKWVNKWK